MKYKIMHSEEPVSDDEIRAYQSFDKLLSQHKQYLWKQTLFRRIGFGMATVCVMMAGLIYYKYSNSAPKQLPTSPVTVVQQQAPALRQPEKNAAPATPAADTILVNAPDTKTNATDRVAVKKALPATPAKKNTVEAKPADIAADPTKTSFKEAAPVGGYQPLFDYFQQSLRYPEQARLDSITGTVIIGFAINAAGKPQDLEVVKSINPALDQEALRLVAQMPRWNPALLNGKPVTTRQTVPLTFQLTTSSK